MGFDYTERGFVMPRYKTVTASGNPVTLDAAKRLRQLTIYGNAVQDGTPSPDAPVEVQLCGDRTGNLLDYNRLWDEVYYEGNFKCVKLYLKPNTQYTLSTNIPLSNVRYAGVYLSTNDTYISGDNSPASVNVPATVETDNSGLLVAIVRYNGDNLIIPSEEDFKNGTYWVMLNEGSTAQPYEPYGYKVSGRVEGVNLYNVNDRYQTWNTAVTDDAGWVTVNYDNTEGTSGNWPSLYTNFRDVIEPSTEYTIVTEIEYISGCALHPNTTGSPKSAFNTLFSYTQQGTHYMTVTSESDLSDCETLLRSNYLVEPGNIGSAKFRISLLKGSYTADTIPPYEPYQPPQEFAVYLPQQIAKVGDVADTVVVDFEKRTATLVQNIRRLDFTGEEKWDREVKAKNRFYLNASLGLPASRQPAISNRFVTANLSSPQHHDDLTTFAHGTSIYIYYAAMDTIDDFKAFLAANPTYAYVQYATPVTTDITAMQDWDAMPQVKGTVTLTLSAEVEPSGAEAVYISSRSPKPKVQTIADVVINEADPEHTEASEQEQADEAAALNIEMITYE